MSPYLDQADLIMGTRRGDRAEIATAYAMMSIATSLEKLASFRELDEAREKTVPPTTTPQQLTYNGFPITCSRCHQPIMSDQPVTEQHIRTLIYPEFYHAEGCPGA